MSQMVLIQDGHTPVDRHHGLHLRTATGKIPSACSNYRCLLLARRSPFRFGSFVFNIKVNLLQRTYHGLLYRVFCRHLWCISQFVCQQDKFVTVCF